jgi:enamine deaminase RidA (YjgF/YER057c/UK114 family)
MVEVSGLARPAQLIEIEFDAVDGASERAQRISSGGPLEEPYGYSRAVRVDDRIFISGTIAQGDNSGAAAGDQYAQTREAMEIILAALDEAGGAIGDIVYSKIFVTDINQAAEGRRARLEALGEVRPTATLLGVPALIGDGTAVEIEAEAIVGAAQTRRDIYTANQREKGRGYARAVEVGDVVHVSGCTSMDADGVVQAPGDWAAQYDLCHEAIAAALAEAGAVLDDVVRRRSFTVEGAERNRAYGEGPAWFAASRPVSLGCRIAGLADPEMLVEVDAWAVKGAHADIEWLGPDD